jgi:hypothetical protein
VDVPIALRLGRMGPWGGFFIAMDATNGAQVRHGHTHGAGMHRRDCTQIFSYGWNDFGRFSPIALSTIQVALFAS